jgi:hypothetical protein
LPPALTAVATSRSLSAAGSAPASAPTPAGALLTQFARGAVSLGYSSSTSEASVAFVEGYRQAGTGEPVATPSSSEQDVVSVGQGWCDPVTNTETSLGLIGVVSSGFKLGPLLNKGTLKLTVPASGKKYTAPGCNPSTNNWQISDIGPVVLTVDVTLTGVGKRTRTLDHTVQFTGPLNCFHVFAGAGGVPFILLRGLKVAGSITGMPFPDPAAFTNLASMTAVDAGSFMYDGGYAVGEAGTC